MKEHTLAIMILTGGILGMVGFVVSLICVAMVAGFTRSTHTVQYVPHETPAISPPSMEELLEENDRALRAQVGRKNKPTVVEPIDGAIEEITESEIKF